jgi:hypothetical protein
MMLNPDLMIAQYKSYIDILCTRTFEEHRKLPCGIIKEAILQGTKPDCHNCSYEKKANKQ